MRFDGPYGSIDMRPMPRTAPLWTSSPPRRDARIVAIRAVLDATPEDMPAHITLAAIRNILKENR